MSRSAVLSLGLGLVVLASAVSAGEVRSAGKDVIPGRYIVVLKDDAARFADEKTEAPEVAAVVQDLAVGYGIKRTRHVYEHALKGFAARMDEATAKALADDPRVDYIEEDFVVRANASQTGATWGIDRVDQRNLPLNQTYNYNTTASNVHAYIVDTGIRATHTQFTGRIGNGYTAINDGNGTNDCQGHGSHVAGTVGGTTHGVAKGVTLHPVRVLGCDGSGSNSGVVAGVDWVRANHVKPAVANMSLGGGASSATDTAVTNAVNAGVVMVVAAGNDNANACNYSPARAAAVLTVGSTTSSDARSSFSNYGTCVDIFAPGSSITSVGISSNTATATMSGTSMASPHACGVAALYMAANPSSSAPAAMQAIVANATSGVVTSPGSGSPNRLVYSIWGSTPPPPPPSGSLQNGGFEGSVSPWALSGNAYYSTGTYPHSGSGYAILGAYDNASGTITQSFTIPSSAAGNLSFWVNITSAETTTTTRYDFLYVEVLNSSGSLLKTVATYSNLDKGTAGAYSQKSFAGTLAAYRGQAVQLRFRGTTDSSLVTSFRLDDVAVN